MMVCCTGGDFADVLPIPCMRMPCQLPKVSVNHTAQASVPRGTSVRVVCSLVKRTGAQRFKLTGSFKFHAKNVYRRHRMIKFSIIVEFDKHLGLINSLEGVSVTAWVQILQPSVRTALSPRLPSQPQG
jgi:hypothetical protein